MNVDFLFERLNSINIDFFSGVPDSLLKPVCDYLYNNKEKFPNHIIAPNEGNAVALAAGYHLSTGKFPCVYLQNSGLGNIANPVISLLSKDVYSIPCLFLVGWRGEPGIKDEPQHKFQGRITLEFLDLLNIKYFIVDEKTSNEEFSKNLSLIHEEMKNGNCGAIVFKKNSISYEKNISYKNKHEISRELFLEKIITDSNADVFITTTGKTSREMFELREKLNHNHNQDFLTVGSMGHASSIATSIALQKPNTLVCCIDGDGALLMHMGSLSIATSLNLKNFIYILINNESHESVGGQPTMSSYVNFSKLAESMGFKNIFSISKLEELDSIFVDKNSLDLTFIEIKTSIGSRKDLGRPTSTPIENKNSLMNFLKGCN